MIDQNFTIENAELLKDYTQYIKDMVDNVIMDNSLREGIYNTIDEARRDYTMQRVVPSKWIDFIT